MLENFLPFVWLIPMGFFAGAYGALIGVGGGILYVPALVYLLRVPVHIATATSLFVLMITAFTGSATRGVFMPIQGVPLLSRLARYSERKRAPCCRKRFTATGLYAA